MVTDPDSRSGLGSGKMMTIRPDPDPQRWLQIASCISKKFVLAANFRTYSTKTGKADMARG
jgi:hypothetical protein